MEVIDIQKEKEYKKIFNSMTDYVRSLGIVVNTSTKARGHQGFFLKNRIDISTNISYERKIEVLIHEFTHYIHYKIDDSIYKTHGDLNKIFPNADIKRIEKELLCVTRFIDKSKALNNLNLLKDKISSEITLLDKNLKKHYPDFKRSYPYKIIEREIKKSDAKYLLKYDRVKVKTLFLGKTNEYSIKNLDNDFPNLSETAKDYIRIKSKQRAQKRIAARANRLNCYYKRPTELFARFIEALFVDTSKVSEIAPHAYLVFCSELAKGKYFELADLINNFF